MSDIKRNDKCAWIHGGKATCSEPAKAGGKVWRVVLLGAPGVGKGTQAELLRGKIGACQLSTGDVFRAAKQLPPEKQTPAIREAIEVMSTGRLVTDSTVIAMVKERSHCLSCADGFMLDGFPRTVPQAEALSEILKEEKVELDAVISYDLPVDEVVERIAGRRVCSKCKKSYHVKDYPSKVEGICDQCGGSLFQRDDDQPAAVRIRLDLYDRATAPLIQYYNDRNLLVHVPCGQSPQETFKRTLEALKLE